MPKRKATSTAHAETPTSKRRRQNSRVIEDSDDENTDPTPAAGDVSQVSQESSGAYDVADVLGKRKMKDRESGRVIWHYKLRWGPPFEDPKWDSWEPARLPYIVKLDLVEEMWQRTKARKKAEAKGVTDTGTVKGGELAELSATEPQPEERSHTHTGTSKKVETPRKRGVARKKPAGSTKKGELLLEPGSSTPKKPVARKATETPSCGRRASSAVNGSAIDKVGKSPRRVPGQGDGAKRSPLRLKFKAKPKGIAGDIAVLPSSQGSSFNPDDYTYYTPEKAPRFVGNKLRERFEDGIVPDSQILPGSSSYEQPLQTQTPTQNQSQAAETDISLASDSILESLGGHQGSAKASSKLSSSVLVNQTQDNSELKVHVQVPLSTLREGMEGNDGEQVIPETAKKFNARINSRARTTSLSSHNTDHDHDPILQVPDSYQRSSHSPRQDERSPREVRRDSQETIEDTEFLRLSQNQSLQTQRVGSPLSNSDGKDAPPIVKQSDLPVLQAKGSAFCQSNSGVEELVSSPRNKHNDLAASGDRYEMERAGHVLIEISSGATSDLVSTLASSNILTGSSDLQPRTTASGEDHTIPVICNDGSQSEPDLAVQHPSPAAQEPESGAATREASPDRTETSVSSPPPSRGSVTARHHEEQLHLPEPEKSIGSIDTDQNEVSTQSETQAKAPIAPMQQSEAPYTRTQQALLESWKNTPNLLIRVNGDDAGPQDNKDVEANRVLVATLANGAMRNAQTLASHPLADISDPSRLQKGTLDRTGQQHSINTVTSMMDTASELVAPEANMSLDESSVGKGIFRAENVPGVHLQEQVAHAEGTSPSQVSGSADISGDHSFFVQKTEPSAAKSSITEGFIVSRESDTEPGTTRQALRSTGQTESQQDPPISAQQASGSPGVSLAARHILDHPTQVTENTSRIPFLAPSSLGSSPIPSPPSQSLGVSVSSSIPARPNTSSTAELPRKLDDPFSPSQTPSRPGSRSLLRRMDSWSKKERGPKMDISKMTAAQKEALLNEPIPGLKTDISKMSKQEREAFLEKPLPRPKRLREARDNVANGATSEPMEVETPKRQKVTDDSVQSMSVADAHRHLRAKLLDEPFSGPISPTESARSPSVIPDKAPPPMMEQDDPLQSPRLEKLHAHVDVPENVGSAPVEQDDSVLDNAASPNHLPLEPQLTGHEVDIPLTLPPRVKRQYEDTIRWYKDEIQKFISADNELPADDPTVVAVRDCLKKAALVTVHPDLVDDEANLTPILPEEQMKFDVTASSKFSFLNQLLTRLPYETTVIVAAGSVRLLHMLERFIVGMGLDCYVVDGKKSPSPVRDTSVILLRTSGSEGGLGSMFSSLHRNKRMVLLAMDETLNLQVPRFRSIYASMLQADPHAILVRLLIPNSPEFHDRQIPPHIHGHERLRMLVTETANTRKAIGALEEDQLGLEIAAQDLTRYFIEGRDGTSFQVTDPFQIPDVTISGEISGSGSGQLSQLSVTSSAPQGTQNATGVPTQGGSKSVNSSSILATDSYQVQEQLTAGQEALANAQKQLKRYKKREAEFKANMETTAGLFEKMRLDLSGANRARDEAILRSTTLQAKVDTQAATIIQLREANSALKVQVAEAQQALQGVTDPDVATQARLRLENQEKDATITKLRKKVDSISKDFEFMRTQYQTASNAATEYGQRVATLESETVTLKSKLSGDIVKAQQLSQNMRNQKLEEEVEYYKRLAQDREDLLRRKEEELKNARGRQGLMTRGSSVPRSPRIGPQSRAGSPAGAERRERGHPHPLRRG